MKKIIHLGCRGTPLALIQAEIVRSNLFKKHPNLSKDYEIELIPIQTMGDRRSEMTEITLATLKNSRALFTKEIDEALMSGVIDVAVHSAKDIATVLSPTLRISAVLERLDPRDAFIAKNGKPFSALPLQATIGTASLRRQAQLLALRPDLKIKPLYGSLESRFKKVDEGVVDATILGAASLSRLQLTQYTANILDTEIMLPAAGQGAIGALTRQGDQMIGDLIAPLNHAATYTCIMAERAFLATLGGDRRMPIAALGRLASDTVLVLEGLVGHPDGTGVVRLQNSGSVGEAEEIGAKLGAQIKERIPLDLFTEWG